MPRWLRAVLMLLFGGIFVVSAYFLLDYFLESKTQKDQFRDLAQIMEQATVPATAPSDAPQQPVPQQPQPQEELPTEPMLVEVTDPQTGLPVLLLPEFAQLYTMNNHIVGWMRIEGTRVDYPVMQTPDSTDYYLYKGFDKKYSRHGCLYAREECDIFTPSDNVTVYGHRMGDGTMFNDLHKYAKKSFYEEHPYITFDTLTQRRTYQILAVFRIESTVGNPFPYHLFVDASGPDDFDAFIQNCRAYALYDTGVDAQYGDKLITLSTCEYTRVNGRFVVVAKLIHQEG